MIRHLAAALASAALLAAAPACAQTAFPTPQGNQNAPGFVNMCPTQIGVYVPCGTAGAMPFPVTVIPAGPPPNGYPPLSTPITGNAAGTTGAVVGTLAASASSGQTTYICGFNVSALGGTATVGPVTIANLVGTSMVYQMSSTAAGATLPPIVFTPCIPAKAPNTAITITTTADGTATSVDVNSWGFQQ